MLARAAVAVPFVLALVIVPLKTDLFRSEAGMNPLAKVEFEEIRSAQDALFSEMPGIKEGDVVREQAGTGEAGSAGGQTEPGGKSEPADERGATDEALPALQDESAAGSTAGQQDAVSVQARYYLVVGSFLDDGNANRHFNELTASGYDPELVKADNGYYRVSVSSWVTMDKAKEEHRRLAARFPGVWIWKK